jgi:protein tyrosine phosphatase (PTP) superfamily phosphohydrolase (DUF442 family)
MRKRTMSIGAIRRDDPPLLPPRRIARSQQMIKLADIFKGWERRLQQAYTADLSTPANRRRALIWNRWLDHGILRVLWTNQFQIAPGVWRSNHPPQSRFARIKAMGINTVLTLRGVSGNPSDLLEREACAANGIALHSIAMQARAAPTPAQIADLIALFRTLPRPFLMHCKSGADRAGFASAVYLMVIMGEPVETARRMLSPRYLHFSWSKTGVLDRVLDLYAARNAKTPISFEAWAATEYDSGTV